jgi:hypothetical protein
MTPGNLEFVQVVATMIVVPSVQAIIVRADERRLSGERLARAWPAVTRDTVVFATWQFGILFGVPALLVWFIRTRQSLAGVLLGIAASAGLLGAALAASLVPEVAVEWLGL